VPAPITAAFLTMRTPRNMKEKFFNLFALLQQYYYD